MVERAVAMGVSEAALQVGSAGWLVDRVAVQEVAKEQGSQCFESLGLPSRCSDLFRTSAARMTH